MGRRARWLLRSTVILLGVACASCASYSHLDYVPPLQDVELRGAENDLQARVVVAWREVGEHEGVHELRFRLRVENPGPTPFTLVPAEFELLDAALTPFGAAGTESVPTLVEPGRSATFDLAFPVPDGTRLASYELSALTLRARLQGDHWIWSSNFQREPDDPSPAWGFGFGVSIGL